MEEQGTRRRRGFREGRIRQVMNELDAHNEVKIGDAYLVRIGRRARYNGGTISPLQQRGVVYSGGNVKRRGLLYNGGYGTIGMETEKGKRRNER